MNTTDTILARLENARAYAASLDSVASAEVWVPTPEEVAEYAADGIVSAPTLEVTVWRSEGDPSDTKWLIESRCQLACDGDGSGELGPCYTFRVPAAR